MIPIFATGLLVSISNFFFIYRTSGLIRLIIHLKKYKNNLMIRKLKKIRDFQKFLYWNV